MGWGGWGGDRRQKQRNKAGHITDVDQYVMLKDRADTDILPGVTLDLYPFTWTSTENWSWRSARRSGSARNRSGCPSSWPVCHPRRWHPGRTLTGLHLRPLHRHPAGVVGWYVYIYVFFLHNIATCTSAESHFQRQSQLLHPVCIWRGRRHPPLLPPPHLLLLLSSHHRL